MQLARGGEAHLVAGDVEAAEEGYPVQSVLDGEPVLFFAVGTGSCMARAFACA